jgi:hypothetical protein
MATNEQLATRASSIAVQLWQTINVESPIVEAGEQENTRAGSIAVQLWQAINVE